MSTDTHPEIERLGLAISHYRLARAGRPRSNPRPVEGAQQEVIDAARALIDRLDQKAGQ